MNSKDLISLFQGYCQKKDGHHEQKLYGLEYENFVFVPDQDRSQNNYRPISIEGENGVNQILENLVEVTKDEDDPFEKVYENDMLLALKSKAGAKITIEPGGQVELSDAPRASIADSHHSFDLYLQQLKKAISPFDGKLLFQGVQPVHTLDDIPFFPKSRYKIMFPHMLKMGKLGQWMMKASSGVQVSIDFNSIPDIERKFVFLNRLSPFLNAAFANSPLVAGQPSGFLSYRGHIWGDTDPDRSGLPEAFLHKDFVIDDYVSWALTAAPYHLMRDGEIVQTTDWNFQQLMDGKASGLKMDMEDWEEHLGMIFPDIRIKNILEVRVIDSISPVYAMAVPALIGTLLYNENAFDAVQSILMDMPLEEFAWYRESVPKTALKTEINRTHFGSLSRKFFEVALENIGSDDEKWLLPYFQRYIQDGKTPADETLQDFKECGGDKNLWLSKVLNDSDY